MTSYYVRKSGNDSTGDGSSGNPWLTVTKALLTIPTAAAHTLLVGDGIYAESSSGLHYLLVQRAQTVGAWLTIAAENGSAGDVTLSGESSTTYQVRIDGSRYVRFEQIKFISSTNLTNIAAGTVTISGATANHISFVGCSITARSHAANKTYGVFGEVSGSNSWSDFTFEGCMVGQSGTGLATGVRLDRGSDTAALDGITLSDCRMTMINNPIEIFGAANVRVDGGDYLSTSGQAVEVGVNGDTGRTTTGTIRGVYAQSVSGHAVLVGAGCQGFTIQDCTILGGDSGLVLKECSGAAIEHNLITGGSNAALYFKGAASCTAQWNFIHNQAGGCALRLAKNDSSSTKSSAITVCANRICAGTTGSMFDIRDASEVGAGCVIDRNRYGCRGSWGSVYGTSVSSLAGARAAWSGYGDGSNEQMSRNIQKRINFGRCL
jgi:hypothetical protein